MEKSFIELREKLSNLDEEQLQNNFFSACLALSIPFAFWKLPGSDEKNFITEYSSDLKPQNLSISNHESGFAISPFLNSENQESLLIKPDFLFNFKTNTSSINQQVEKEEFSKHFFSLLSSHSIKIKLNDLSEIHTSKDQNHYLNIVEKAKARISQNEFKKVVLAREKTIDINKQFNPITAFNKLCEEHSEAFVSLINIPTKGLWIGASPEMLLSIDKNHIFRTSALAGTQKLCKEESLSKAVWSQKEIEEQALVSRYIINCFKTIRLREYDEDGPKTVRAGNLVHLRTDYCVDMNEVNFPELGTQMLNLLHPTSAICGMPKEPALHFIEKHEEINRKFFSGFIGPVNINKETSIFVNIRCAEIGNGKAVLYSGAGITGESNPERELEETELKMQTMERILTNEPLNYNYLELNN